MSNTLLSNLTMLTLLSVLFVALFLLLFLQDHGELIGGHGY